MDLGLGTLGTGSTPFGLGAESDPVSLFGTEQSSDIGFLDLIATALNESSTAPGQEHSPDAGGNTEADEQGRGKDEIAAASLAAIFAPSIPIADGPKPLHFDLPLQVGSEPARDSSSAPETVLNSVAQSNTNARVEVSTDSQAQPSEPRVQVIPAQNWGIRFHPSVPEPLKAVVGRGPKNMDPVAVQDVRRSSELAFRLWLSQDRAQMPEQPGPRTLPPHLDQVATPAPPTAETLYPQLDDTRAPSLHPEPVQENSGVQKVTPSVSTDHVETGPSGKISPGPSSVARPTTPDSSDRRDGDQPPNGRRPRPEPAAPPNTVERPQAVAAVRPSDIPSQVAQRSSGDVKTITSAESPRTLATEPAAPSRHPSSVQNQVHSIDLRVGPERANAVQVRISERAGAVQVTVRSSDAGLTAPLREHLPSLVHDLQRSGYRTEAWTPSQPESPDTGRSDLRRGALEESQSGNRNGQSEQQQRRDQAQWEDTPKRRRQQSPFLFADALGDNQ